MSGERRSVSGERYRRVTTEHRTSVSHLHPVLCKSCRSTLSQVEELAPPAHVADAAEQKAQMVRIVDEIEALTVDDQERRLLVLIEVARVRIGQPRQIMLGDRTLIVDAAFVHAVDE